MNPFDPELPGWIAADGSLALPDAARPQAAPAEAELSEAVTALVSEYSSTLYRVAFSVLRNAAEAEDVVQETFLRVLRHRDRLPSIRDARVWLVRIAWNLVLDRKRRAKSRPENENVADLANVLPARGLRADTELIAAQRHARVLALIDELPRKEREVLLLTAMEELSTPQIAAILDTTESTIRSRLFRARRDLARMLKREGIAR
jgi:RNA polymerase sigma-70 factor (ECF subfamily)